MKECHYQFNTQHCKWFRNNPKTGACTWNVAESGSWICRYDKQQAANLESYEGRQLEKDVDFALKEELKEAQIYV